MKKIKIFLTCILLGVSAIAFAQNMQVKGVVTDAKTGDPISFASVQVAGTMTGTTTDANGNYAISVPSKATLVFSFLGYKTQSVAVDGKTIVNCTLNADSEYLDDVLVVAYGTAKKESFTGSASVIKSEQIEKRTVSNVTKALDGLAAGVQTTSGSGQPGAGVSVHIRGIGSINASASPLYVVDGIPYDGALNALNPNDIESMTVIKDASAGALYGSRGANGVVIITTKKGSDSAVSVDFKAQVGISSRAVPRYNTLGTYAWTEDLYGQFKRANMSEGYDEQEAAVMAAAMLADESSGVFGVNEQYNPFTKPAAELFDHATGKIVKDAKLKWNEDWLDECMATAPVRQEYQLGISGGNARTKYMFSIGYLNEQGLVKYTDFERFSGRANVESQVLKWFKTGLNVNFAHTISNMTSLGSSSSSSSSYSNVFYTNQLMAPIYPIYLRDPSTGKLILDANGQKQYDWGENRAEGASAGWNPLANLVDDKYNLTADNLSGRAFIDLGGLKTGPLAGLKFSANFGFDYYNSKELTYYNPFFGNGKTKHGLAYHEDSGDLSYTFNQLLTYDRAFGKHHIDVLVGHEAYSLQRKYLMAEKSGFPVSKLYELAPATTIEDATSYTDNYRVESFLSRLNYDYADKYYFSASYRRDGSSRFRTENRWGNFWSVGGSWRISQENFLKDVNWLNNLTLKASYGVQGNDNLGSYYPWQLLYDPTYANGSNPGATIASLESADLRWEKNNNFNVGIEARMFNRLSATIEYYNRYTSDMLMSYPMAVSLGFSGYNKNIGNMSNQGVEITLSGDIIKTDKVVWNMTWMGSTTHNKVVKLTDDTKEIISGNSIIREGEPLNSFYMPEGAGVDPATGDKLYWVWNKAASGNNGEQYAKNAAGQIVDANGNICNATDDKGNPVYRYISNDQEKALNSRKICGNRQPKLYGSWSNTLQIGDFDMSLMTTYSIGGKMYDSIYTDLLYSSYIGQTGHVDRQKAWQKPGDITNIPRIDANGVYDITNTGEELFDASYFAIKNITIGYTIPAKALQAIHFKAIRISLTADNLCLFSAMKGMDPTYNFSGGNGYSYTPTRTISLGLDFKF